MTTNYLDRLLKRNIVKHYTDTYKLSTCFLQVSPNNHKRESGLFPLISVLLDISCIEEDTPKITHAHLHGNKLFRNVSFVLFQRNLFKLIIINSSSCYNDYIINVTVVFICILFGKANQGNYRCEIELLPIKCFQTLRTKLFASNAQEYISRLAQRSRMDLRKCVVLEWVILFIQVLVNPRFEIHKYYFLYPTGWDKKNDSKHMKSRNKCFISNASRILLTFLHFLAFLHVYKK